MPAGGKASLQVTYWPSQASLESAQLVIGSSAPSSAGQTVALSGSGSSNKHQVDNYVQPLLPKVDLLFVIDNSGSFAQFQQALSAQASALICAAKNDPGNCATSGWKVDFHIGVIGNEADQTDTADSESAYPGSKIYVGGLFGSPAIITNNTANAAAAFAKNVKLGTCCSSNRESDAEAAWRALTPPANQTAAPVGSLGFLREDARLVLVAITDEDTADPATLVVRVLGVKVSTPADYTYDAGTNSVTFTNAPPPDGSVSFEYDNRCF